VKIRMRVGISGTRSGEDWPAPGGTLEVDDEEGMQLCAGGLAEPVVEQRTETAVLPEPEKRGPGRPKRAA
jgi:hypothetical protein